MKTFDAVGMMRALRDNLSQEMEQMRPEERIRYIRDKAASTDLERKIAAHRADTAQQAPHPTA